VTAEKVLHKFLRIKTRKDQTLKGRYGATQRTKRKRELMQKPQGKSKETREWNVEGAERRRLQTQRRGRGEETYLEKPAKWKTL